jgi:hypothetical protein
MNPGRAGSMYSSILLLTNNPTLWVDARAGTCPCLSPEVRARRYFNHAGGSAAK